MLQVLGGQRDRTNEDGAAIEELATLEAEDVGVELHREPDHGGYTFRCGASSRVEDFESFPVLHAERPRLTSIKKDSPDNCRVYPALGIARNLPS